MPTSNLQRPGNEKIAQFVALQAENEQDNGPAPIAVPLGLRQFVTITIDHDIGLPRRSDGIGHHLRRIGVISAWLSEETAARIERKGFPAQSPLSANDQAKLRNKEWHRAVDEAKAIENHYHLRFEPIDGYNVFDKYQGQYQALIDEAGAIENKYQAIIDAAALADDGDEGKDGNNVFAATSQRRRGGKKYSGTDIGLPVTNAAASATGGDVIELSSSSSSSEDSNDAPSDSPAASLKAEKVPEKGATGAKSSTSTDGNDSTANAVSIDELRALAETAIDELNSVDSKGSSSYCDRLLSTIAFCKTAHGRLRAYYRRSSMVNFTSHDRKDAAEFLRRLEKACQRATDIAQNFGSSSSAARSSTEIDQSSNGVIDALPSSGRARANANSNSPATSVDLGCLALYSNELAELQKHLQEHNHSDLADALSSCTGLARQLKSLIDGSTQITFLEKADKVLSDMNEAIEKGSILIGESLNDPTSAPAPTSIKPTPTGSISAGTGPSAKKPRSSYKPHTHAYQSRHFAFGSEASYGGAAAFDAMAKEAHGSAAWLSGIDGRSAGFVAGALASSLMDSRGSNRRGRPRSAINTIQFPSDGATDAERCAFLAMAMRDSRFDPDPGSRNYGLCCAFQSFADAAARFVISYPNNMGSPVRRGFVHKRAVQLYKCLRELLKKAKPLTPSKICNTLYFPQDGPNMKLIHEYFEHGTISAERFEVELSMYNQIDW